MSSALALEVLQWAAIVVVYLGLAAVLRETRLLRSQVSRLQLQVSSLGDGRGDGGALTAAPTGAREERLPQRVTGGADGIVLVADTTCPSCARVVERLTRHRDGLRVPITLLTWEPEESWSHLDPVFRVVRDAEGWSEVAHLTPPILLRVAADGRVLAIQLPSDVDDVDTTLASWGALAPVTERDHA